MKSLQTTDYSLLNDHMQNWHSNGATSHQVQMLIKLLSKTTGEHWSKSKLLKYYHNFLKESDLQPNLNLLSILRRKPIRTLSGVAPITVLTKPFACPGQCIFCPNDVRMPKSYLADEPGAQRAERNWFDPYLQTYNRLQALVEIGHHVDKAELIVLGGTWSFYPESYQIWFIAECFRALNEFSTGKDDRLQREKQYQLANLNAKNKGKIIVSNDPTINEEAARVLSIKGTAMSVGEYNRVITQHYSQPEKNAGISDWQVSSWSILEKMHHQNETASVRCVGLVLETRPDSISPKEVIKLRKFGATKIQIGVQSLNDSVLKKNRRGHDVKATKDAFSLLRQAGFKIHAHWMANLYGSSPSQDKLDFKKFFEPDFCPDELKIYPCSLIDSAELIKYYEKKLWKPYSEDQLASVIKYAILHSPAYCRLTRIIRDIPGQYIVAGNKKTNFRQIVEKKIEKNLKAVKEIRTREIRHMIYDPSEVKFLIRKYKTSISQEIFIEANLPSTNFNEGLIIGFCRLSLPRNTFIEELSAAAMIRELHVYGKLTQLGSVGNAQHVGWGSQLLQKAKLIAKEANYKKLAVISAIGTKEYYRKQGFIDGELYQFCDLKQV